MPNSVNLAAATGVMPLALSRQFARMEEYAVNENIYASGESQRGILISLPRIRWQLARRLTASQLYSLRTFYDEARVLNAFWFYDPRWTVPLFSYDPTGADPNGRYIVRFDSTQWTEDFELGRYPTAVNLIQLA